MGAPFPPQPLAKWTVSPADDLDGMRLVTLTLEGGNGTPRFAVEFSGAEAERLGHTLLSAATDPELRVRHMASVD
ncbi:MAG: hypothetical protein IT472_08995 [Thermomonas sp.]|uniref:hypothetical protein n=1 Tax=Thermomonas sp. TaxID=1971895 RepID=UPI002614C2A7|nr:hypothetical protein [Thermomonas sp.]MCC7097302.1 hypothetical protein [Thermomonas sp.]